MDDRADHKPAGAGSGEANLYAPPQAELRELVARTPRPKTAIVAAALFDLVATIVVTTLASVGYGLYLASGGASPAEIEAAVQGMPTHTGFRTLVSTLGLLVSVAAGYLCARLAVLRVYRYTLLCGLLLTIIVRLLNLDPGLTLIDLALNAATFAALLFGAWLFVRRQT